VDIALVDEESALVWPEAEIELIQQRCKLRLHRDRHRTLE
jgi:hypothetical protein